MSRVILLAITHYKNTTELERFLRHISGFDMPDAWQLKVAVTDNSGDLKLPEGLLQGITIFKTDENMGYLRGCAYAIDNWVKEHKLYPEWTIISNTDVKFDGNYFKNLSEIAPGRRICCLAPDIFLQNGVNQNPHMRFRPGRLEMYAYTLIYRSVLLTGILDRLYCFFCNTGRLTKSKKTSSCRQKEKNSPDFEIIYAPHGSCFVLHRTFFNEGGKIDFKGFMYGEEVYIAEEVRKRKLKTAWAPVLKVVHFKKSTTGRVLHKQKVRWRLEIAEILWKDYFSKK